MQLGEIGCAVDLGKVWVMEWKANIIGRCGDSDHPFVVKDGETYKVTGKNIRLLNNNIDGEKA